MKMLNDTEIELVRRFHESDLSEEELVLINQRIETDPVFRKEVERLGLVRDTIIQLVKHEQQTPESPTKGAGKSGSKNRLWLFVMVACLLLAGCFMYYQYTLSQTKQQIFADCETFAYSISSDIMRSETSSNNPRLLSVADEATLQNIISNYKNKDLSIAEKEALLLKKSSKDTNAQEIVAWWLVTIYLQSGETVKATDMLEEIRSRPNFNSKSTATEILDDL